MPNHTDCFRLLVANAAKGRIEDLRRELRTVPFWRQLRRRGIRVRIEFMQAIHDNELRMRTDSFRERMRAIEVPGRVVT